jgi:hypothetical protein
VVAHALACMAVWVAACGSSDDSVPAGSSNVSGTNGTSGNASNSAGGGLSGTGGDAVVSGGAGSAVVGQSGAGGAASAGSGGSSGSSGSGGGHGGSSGSGGSGGVGVGGSGGSGGSGNQAGAPTPGQLLALVQTCAKVVSAHRYATDDGGNATVDICGLNGAVFWKADMDIDCDGRNVGDGKCPGNDCCYQPQTAFENKSHQPLAASVTPYVVIPNDFKYAGLNGGTVVAVIYNNKLEYAVFGDTGPNSIIGEASYACAAGLGINPDPGNGGTNSGVTYIAFVGTGTVPSDIEDQAVTKTLGEKLAAQLLQSN